MIWLLPGLPAPRQRDEVARDLRPRESWIPTDFSLFQNISDAITLSGLGDSVVSTLIYAIVSPAIAVLVGAAAGYAIVALRLKHGFAWFVFLFGGSIFPLQMIMLPLFDSYSRVGLFDNRLGMILIYTAISIPFSAFVMRNFFTGISHNVFEAAVVDGASSLRIFARIYLPMSFSALVAIFILQATFIWNDLLLGLTLVVERQRAPDRDHPGRHAEHLRRRAVVDRARRRRHRVAADRRAVPAHAALLRRAASPSASTDSATHLDGAFLPSHVPTIPTVDDLAADAVTHHYDDMIAPTGLTNLLGTVRRRRTTCRCARA